MVLDDDGLVEAEPGPHRSIWQRRRKLIFSGIAVLVIIVAGVVLYLHLPRLQARPISGLVRCVSGADIAGIWIVDHEDPSGNGGGMVRSPVPIRASGPRPKETRYTYDNLHSPTYEVHVGCGKKADSGWLVPANSKTIGSSYAELLCYDLPSDTKRYGTCDTLRTSDHP